MPTHPGEATCPECGSERLLWSLRRWNRGSGGGATPLRYFAWLCPACGATWAEPMLNLGSLAEVDQDRKPD